MSGAGTTALSASARAGPSAAGGRGCSPIAGTATGTTIPFGAATGAGATLPGTTLAGTGTGTGSGFGFEMVKVPSTLPLDASR